MISEYQRYLFFHIESITVEVEGDKLYGTLIDKSGNVYEYIKDKSEVEKRCLDTSILYKTTGNKTPFLLHCFKKMMVYEHSLNRLQKKQNYGNEM